YDRKTLQEKVDYTLNILHLQNCADKMPSELSGGMRKRVGIARSLIIEPRLLLFDEPTSELDPISAANITEVIGTLREEFDMTSIVVSHDRELAMNIGERVALMGHGEVVMLDKPEKLAECDDPRVVDFLKPSINCKDPRFRQAVTNGNGNGAAVVT
ncbi:MAG: ATP-binding cassette domain-containing protein, partial [Verrucomicrobiota bacterium]